MVAMIRPILLLGTSPYLGAHATSQQQPLQALQQLAPPALESHPVYILDTTCAAGSISLPLGQALNKIGYSPHRPWDSTPGSARAQNWSRAVVPPNTYTCLSIQGGEYVHLARHHPEAKFMADGARDGAANASGQGPSRPQWQAMRRFFAQQAHESQLLVIDVYAPEPADQAENWEKICRFLGLGYSMVERMGLWLLP